MSEFVYAIERPDGLVKLGYTENLHNRIVALRWQYQLPLRGLGYALGSIRQERELHSLLARECDHGEWFKKGRLVRHVLTMMAPWPIDAGAPRRRGRFAYRGKPESWRNQLKTIIAASPYSMRELSLKAGQSPGAVHSWINDGKKPSFDRFAAVCALLGIEPSAVMTGEAA